MKPLLTILLFINYSVATAQPDENSFGHVIYVKGEIRKPNDSLVKRGDTLWLSTVKLLRYLTSGSTISFYQPSIGNVILSPLTMKHHGGHHESFGDFLAHLFKIKEKRIPLATRGDCSCSSPAGCFSTDTAVNSNILLIDSISFVPDESIFEVERAYYYLQYNKEKKRLRIQNGHVIITPSDLAFTDMTISEGETPVIMLGLFKSNFGITSSSLVAQTKFRVSTANEIREYYRSLKAIMEPTNPKDFYEIFCSNVYSIWGKPNECQLNLISITSND